MSGWAVSYLLDHYVDCKREVNACDFIEKKKKKKKKERRKKFLGKI